MERSDFIVFVSDITSEGMERTFEVTSEQMSVLGMAAPLVGPIGADFFIQRHRRDVLVKGRVGGEVRLQCSRCLADLPFKVESAFDISFEGGAGSDTEKENEKEKEKESELSPSDLEVMPLREGKIDLREVIAEQVHLAIPFKPLCTDTCRGLCSRCGANLNLQDCGCVSPGLDPRWEALKKLKVE